MHKGSLRSIAKNENRKKTIYQHQTVSSQESVFEQKKYIKFIYFIKKKNFFSFRLFRYCEATPNEHLHLFVDPLFVLCCCYFFFILLSFDCSVLLLTCSVCVCMYVCAYELKPNMLSSSSSRAKKSGFPYLDKIK